jgi:hypothetical protein
MNTFSRLLIFVIASLLITGCGHTAQQTSPLQTPTSTPSNEVRSKFSAKIENVSLYPVPSNSRDLAISVVVTVSNSGGAGVAQGWALSVNCPTRTDLKSAEPVHINGVVDMPGFGGQVDLGKEDLVLKSKQAPIASGHPLKGILTFVLPHTSTKELSNNGTTMAISFKDDRGSSYQTPPATIGTKLTP